MAHESMPAFPSGAEAVPVDIVFVRPGARELDTSGGDATLAPATSASAGFDLRVCLEGGTALVIPPGERRKIATGIAVQPRCAGVAGFVYSRSGLGAREGLVVAQGVGIIDPDYTGEIFVYLLNTSGETRSVSRGERVAQLVFQTFARPRWREVTELAATERGDGGFGHTGR